MPLRSALLNRLDLLRWSVASTAVPQACTSSRDRSAKAQPPNIVVTIADDPGFSDISCNGGEIHTPALNGLAEHSFRFRSFYHSACRCPTRASLLIGLYSHQAGVGHLMSGYRWDGEPLLGYIGNLSKRCAMTAEVLGKAAHRTLIGEWTRR